LACHLYKFQKGVWPSRLDDLVPDYLPSVLGDPATDGKQAMGYILIKNGLPDGSERPLVYFRENDPDGLFYRLDTPEFGFYFGDGTARPSAEQRNGGEFIDIALWKPPEQLSGPTTQALPPQPADNSAPPANHD